MLEEVKIQDEKSLNSLKIIINPLSFAAFFH
jgi:hypothetical protein